jgi:hypothetical protein
MGHRCDPWPVLRWQDDHFVEDWGETDCKIQPRQAWQKQGS